MTKQTPIFAALNLPAVSVLPSVNTVQWTRDGQILLLTKSAVHILVCPEPFADDAPLSAYPLIPRLLHWGLVPIS